MEQLLEATRRSRRKADTEQLTKALNTRAAIGGHRTPGGASGRKAGGSLEKFKVCERRRTDSRAGGLVQLGKTTGSKEEEQ